MDKLYFVYILQSINYPHKTYVGFTERLDERLNEHNTGSTVYSKRYAPWKRITYTAFLSKTKALAFEKYLKTPTGKAFINKRLI